MKATEHFDQQLTSLRGARTYYFSDFRQYLDLVTVWCTYHSNKTSDLNGAMPAPLMPANSTTSAITLNKAVNAHEALASTPPSASS